MARRPLIFLVGPRGSGKTTVARLLAEATGLEWIDADEVLKRQAMISIRELFAREGEAGFRRRESKVLEELVERGYPFTATGGGVVLLEENRTLMKSAGRVVWLTADFETLWQRLSRDAASLEQRPNLTVGGREEVEQILTQREPLYRAVADYIVDTTNRSPEEVAADILTWLTGS